MHGLPKSCNIDMWDRMGKFRKSVVQKTNLGTVPMCLAKLFRLNYTDTGNPLKVSEQGWGLIPSDNPPKSLTDITSGTVFPEILIFQLKTS